jgi:hypothetical protein
MLANNWPPGFAWTHFGLSGTAEFTNTREHGMSNDVAPIVFISYAHDSVEHKERVREFATFLHAVIGLEVVLDQWDDSVRRDWALWATQQLTSADFVIVIASPDYRKRAEGTVPAHEGRGSQYEAMVLRDALTKDLRAATRRILPVVLPGGSVDDIPAFLAPYSTTHFVIDAFTRDEVADLLNAITGTSARAKPRRGQWSGGLPPDQGEADGTLRWRAHSPGPHIDTATIDGLHYPGSIVLRSTGETTAAFVDIELGGAYRRFTAFASVLDDAREPFQVARFRVLVDGRPVAEHESALGKPRDIDVSVAGGLVLRLEMYRATGSVDLAWADPTLT